MNAVERLEQWVQLAQQNGFEVRHEYFGGTGGGVCEYAGKTFLFLDLALSTVEQLERLRLVLSEAGICNENDPTSGNPNPSETNPESAQVGFRSIRQAS